MGEITEKMIEFAEAIAEELGIEEPDYSDFNEVKMFIDNNKDDYCESKYGKRY